MEQSESIQADTQSKSIVVGVGRGGVTSEHAVREGLSIATRGEGNELHIVTALKDSKGGDLDGLRQLLRDEEDWLVEYVRWVADHTELRKTRLDLVFHVRIGDPAEVLTQVAYDVSAGLVIVGAAKRGRVAQVLNAGVAEKLFADGRYPLFVARQIDDEGLEPTERPEPRRPGETLVSSREAVLELADRVDYSPPSNHVSGLL